MSGNINDIKSRIGFDVTEFKAGTTELNRELRGLNAEFRSATGGMDNWRDSIDGVQARIKKLEGTTDIQKKKISLLIKEHEKLSKEYGEDSKAAKNLENKILNLNGELGRNEKNLRNARGELDKFGDESVKAKKDTEKLEKSIVRLNKTADKMNSIGNAMTMGVTLPIVAAGGAMLKFGMDLEATEAKYGTVFGSMRGEMQSYIDDWQELVAISEVGARTVASGIQDLLVPMKFSRDVAQDMTEEYMTVIGALTNFNSATKTGEDVARAFQSAIVGEYTVLKDLGIQADVSTVKQRAVSMGLAASTKEVTKQHQALALLEIAYEQSGDALAAFNKESLDTKTKLNIALNELKDVAAEFGQDFIPLLITGIKTLDKLIDKLQDMTPAGRKAVTTLALIAAGTGPVLKGTSGILKSVAGIKKTFATFSAAKVVGEMGSVASAATTAGSSMAGLGTLTSLALGPIGIGLGLLAAGGLVIAATNKQINEVTDSLKENIPTAKEFYEELNGTDKLEELNSELHDTSTKIDHLSDTMSSINTSMEFKINSSVLDEARSIISELHTEYGKLLLAMDDGGASTSTMNDGIISLKDSLITAKENAILPYITAVQNSNESDAEKVRLIKEQNAILDTYSDEVTSVTDGMILLNNSIFDGNEITTEQIALYSEHQEKLLALGASEEEVYGKVLNLVDANKILHDGMAQGLSKTDAFALATGNYADLLGTKLAPVYDTITTAKKNYNQAIEDGQASYEADVLNAQNSVTENSNMVISLSGLQEKYSAWGNTFSDYIKIQIGEGDDLNKMRKTSADAFAETLSDEEILILSKLESSSYMYSQLSELQDEYISESETAQSTLQELAENKESILTQSEADAAADALETIRLAVESFSQENGMSLEQAFGDLDLALQESGIQLDTSTQEMITKLTTFQSELTETTATAGGEAFQELILPFEEAESAGESLIDNLVSGITTQIDNRLEDTKKAGKKGGVSVADGFDEGAEVNSASKRTIRTASFLIDGLVIGLSQNAYRAYEKAYEIAETTAQIFEDVWEEQSASKRAIRSGGHYIGGLTIGMDNEADQLYAGVNRIISTLADGGALSNVGNHTNQNSYQYNTSSKSVSQTFAPKVEVHGGIESPEYRRAINDLMRQQQTQAAMIAGG